MLRAPGVVVVMFVAIILGLELCACHHDKQLNDERARGRGRGRGRRIESVDKYFRTPLRTAIGKLKLAQEGIAERERERDKNADAGGRGRSLVRRLNLSLTPQAWATQLLLPREMRA